MGEEIASAPGVAGRIGAHAPHRLTDGIERWVGWLKSLGKRPSTVDAYRRTVNAWKLAGPHEWVHDLEYGNVSVWMAWKRSEGHWTGRSYNHALAAFRSLSGYMAKIGWLAKDTISDADRAAYDEAPGARAATTPEVRALIEQAVLRAGDGRAKGNRALYWACLALTGARYGEPAAWVWGDFDLDGEIPTLTWRPEVQKIAKRVTLALHPDLAGLLREWRQVSSSGPEQRVFPIQATRPAFKDDAVRSGIDPEGFSPHSIRKHFETTLVNSNVPSRLVDVLMRHSLGVQGAYYRPSLEAQAAALSKMPDVWTRKIWHSPTPGMESADESAKVAQVTLMLNTHVQTADARTAAANIGVTSDLAGSAGVSALSGIPGDSGRLNAPIGVSAWITGADPIGSPLGELRVHTEGYSNGPARPGRAGAERLNPDSGGGRGALDSRAVGRRDDLAAHQDVLNFGVAGRDNRPTEPPALHTQRTVGVDAPGERPGHPITDSGRSALGDFLRAQAAIDRARVERDDALARLMGGER